MQTVKELVEESCSKYKNKTFLVDWSRYFRKEYSYEDIHKRAIK